MIQEHQGPADLSLHTWPTTIHGAEAAFVEVTVHNRTSGAWNPDADDPVYVSYHWINERGEWLRYDGLRTPVPMLVAPGEQLRLVARIHPPAVPGSYRLVLDLMRDKGGWLKLDKILIVEVRPVTERRATLVVDRYGQADEISDNVRHKLRLLRKWGFAPLILTHQIDPRLSLDDQACSVEVGPEQIFRADPNHEWMSEHFWRSSLYVFEYAGAYPLLELICVAPNSPAMLDYHCAAAPTQPAIDGSLHDLELETNHLDLVAYADYVIVHNEDARRLLIETGLIAPERVVMIHYGIPIDQFDPRDESKTPPELEAGRGPILLYVGGLDGAREIDTLMRMVARVRQEYADVRLVLIDSDRSTPSASSGGAIRKLAADLGVENSVIFAEPKDHADLARYYAACDVYVTVGGNEGFDATIAEAMASRKPVVAPNASAPRAIVGDAGFLFEPGNLEEFGEQVLAVLDSKARAKGQVTPSSATPAVYGS